jgi:hypothetical protein
MIDIPDREISALAYIERAAIVAEAKRDGGFARRACQAFFRRKFEQSARESHGLAN